MADQWYYAHEFELFGPFSGRLLADEAIAGKLLPTDMVWKEGVEAGVVASRVKYLFPVAGTSPGEGDSPIATLPAPLTITPVVLLGAELPSATDDAAVTAVVGVEVLAGAVAVEVLVIPLTVTIAPPVLEKAPAPEAPRQPAARPRARAVAGAGALIVGQDGNTVKFRKMCTTCRYEDSSWKTIPIKPGTTRVAFYCPKCRKQRQAEIHGYAS